LALYIAASADADQVVAGARVAREQRQADAAETP
jgi:hypothetical protein